jgi:hypothetical protein
MTKRAIVPFVVFACMFFALLPGVGQTDPPHTETEPIESETVQPEVSAAETESSEVPIAEPEMALTEVAAEEESDFDVELEGRKTWSLSYGLGNAIGLATSGLAPGQLSLDQTLTVDVVGEALSILTIEAHYNDQMPETMQTLALYLDTERLDGGLGDFTFGSIPGFASYNKKMMGLQLEYLIGDAVLTAVVSKTQGVSESVIFVGKTAHAEIEYAQYSDLESKEPASYRVNLEGLFAYPLEALYTEAFSSVHAQFSVSPSLRSVFSLYEVGYLYDAVITEPQLELKAYNYRVLDLDEQVLLLQRAPTLLIRDWLRALIDEYNEQILPEDGERKIYPFTAGTDYELAFLEAVAPFAQLVVDDILYPIGTAQQRRFYDLGHGDVRENSVSVQISTDGVVFETVPNFRLPDYEIVVHGEAGVIECLFPSSFYTATSRLRVNMDYVVSDGAFMLGLSMIPGSERVTLNSSPLERDIDYMIDYEVGLLFMLVELEDTDVLQVDYELYAGGLGSTSDYASYFYGLSLDLPLSESLRIQANILQLADMPGSAADAQSVRTMPNRHTIAGVQADLSLEDFTANVLIGYNEDRFPFDDNARISGTNRVNTVASGEGYVLFGHRGGLTVNDAGNWQTYGLESGLSSRTVQTVAFGDGVAYVGTDSGLTVISLDGSSPFDRAANWVRYFVDDGLPNANVTAVLVREGIAWVGTQDGLVSVPVAELDSYENWTQFDHDGFAALPPITALSGDENNIYIGTERGVYVYDVEGKRLQPMSGTDGYHINDLELANQTLYAASDRGLRGFRDGSGMGWLVLGEPVTSIAYADDTLYYGLQTGLVALDSSGASTLIDTWGISALTSSDNGLWVGTQASETYELAVWQIAEGQKKFAESTTGIPGVDPYAFSDSSADENTVTGWVTRGSFRRNADGYTISGVVETLPPTFRPIGSTRRVDNTGWTLSGDFSLGNAGSLRVDHDYRLSDQLGETPSTRMSNGLFLDWSVLDGPEWQASIRQVEIDETDRLGDQNARELTMSVSTQETFFRDALRLVLSWDRFSFAADRWEEEWQRETISISVDWQLTQALSTDGKWSRPVRFIDETISGTEQLSWSWDWATSVGFADVDVEYSTNWASSLFEDGGTWVHEAEARFDGESFQGFGWEFSPDLKLEGEYERSSADLHAEFVLRSEIEEFSLRSTLRGHLTELGRPVFNREGELSLNAKYSGFADLDLSMTYSGSRSAAVLAEATAPASSDSLIGRLIWTPEDGPRDEFSFSLRIKESETSRQVTASIDNAFTLNLSTTLTRWLNVEDGTLTEGYPIADLRLDSKAEYRGGTANPELTFSTTARVLLAMAPRWNVSFATTYQLGHKVTIGFYHSLALELTFAIEF